MNQNQLGKIRRRAERGRARPGDVLALLDHFDAVARVRKREVAWLRRDLQAARDALVTAMRIIGEYRAADRKRATRGTITAPPLDGPSRSIGAMTLPEDRPVATCRYCGHQIIMLAGYTDHPEVATWTHAVRTASQHPAKFVP